MKAGGRHTRIVLSPTNPNYRSIVLTWEDAEQFEVLAGLVAVLRGE